MHRSVNFVSNCTSQYNTAGNFNRKKRKCCHVFEAKILTTKLEPAFVPGGGSLTGTVLVFAHVMHHYDMLIGDLDADQVSAMMQI